jgi:hypothetical protein
MDFSKDHGLEVWRRGYLSLSYHRCLDQDTGFPIQQFSRHGMNALPVSLLHFCGEVCVISSGFVYRNEGRELRSPVVALNCTVSGVLGTKKAMAMVNDHCKLTHFERLIEEEQCCR